MPVVTEVNEDYQIKTTSKCEDDRLLISEELLLGDATIAYAEGEMYKFDSGLQMDYQTIDTSGDVLQHSVFCK